MQVDDIMTAFPWPCDTYECMITNYGLRNKAFNFLEVVYNPSDFKVT